MDGSEWERRGEGGVGGGGGGVGGGGTVHIQNIPEEQHTYLHLIGGKVDPV